MPYTPITTEEVSTGAPVDASLMGKVKNNFEAQEAELIEKTSDILGLQEQLADRVDEINAHAQTLSLHLSMINDQDAEIEDLKSQDPWINLSFSGAWVNYDANSWGQAAYYKDEMGIVRLKGLIRGGTGQIGTLPVGYRPSHMMMFCVWSTSAAARIDVYPGGEIYYSTGPVATGTGNYVTLTPIQFRAAD